MMRHGSRRHVFWRNRPTVRVVVSVAASGALWMWLGAAAYACVGDCDGDGEVTVNEIVTSVNIALDVAALTTCPSADRDGDGAVTVDEIVVGINDALNGCPTPTVTPLAPSPTATGGAAGTPTGTPAPTTPAATPTASPTASAPVATAGMTATPTGTATTGAAALTCHFVADSSQLMFQAKTAGVAVGLSGSQVWRFAAAQADGTRELVSLPADSHFDCLSASVLGAFQVSGCLRMDPASQGHGVLDCVGGQVGGGYAAVVSIDHNTNQNNDGFPQDPQCAEVYRNPNNDADGDPAPSWVEDGSGGHVHIGVCNSGAHVDQAGAFPAGGLQLTQDLLLRVFLRTPCTPALCPADGAPFDAAAGDVRVTAAMSSGSAKGVIFNLNNGALVLGTTGSGDGASICGLSGTDPCVTSAAGAPYPALCTDLSAGNLHAGKLVAAFTALDLPSPVFDVLATVGITCD